MGLFWLLPRKMERPDFLTVPNWTTILAWSLSTLALESRFRTYLGTTIMSLALPQLTPVAILAFTKWTQISSN